MNSGRFWAIMALVLVTASVDAQPRSRDRRDPASIRVTAGGNELVVARTAAVAYTTLEALLADVGQPELRQGAPLRVVRDSPRQMIDYVFCVTAAGTLVVGERVSTFDEGHGRYVFTRGEMERSYPPLEDDGEWRWLFEIPLSREATVALELRARARWPVEAVAVTPLGPP